MPPKILFVDVETTGLEAHDRIVSLATILLTTRPGLLTGQINLTYTHSIFDPGRKSHPIAESVHGYDDWLLRHQQPFADTAHIFARRISESNLVVAHNAEFDLSFINRELLAAGISETSIPGVLHIDCVPRPRSFLAGKP